jgi:hypothetical protein
VLLSGFIIEFNGVILLLLCTLSISPWIYLRFNSFNDIILLVVNDVTIDSEAPFDNQIFAFLRGWLNISKVLIGVLWVPYVVTCISKVGHRGYVRVECACLHTWVYASILCFAKKKCHMHVLVGIIPSYHRNMSFTTTLGNQTCKTTTSVF